MGKLKAPDPLRHRSGKSALLMAEQLTLQEPRRNRRAVELDEGTAGPGAVGLDGSAMRWFPVPVSPRISTVDSVGATISTCFSAAFRAALVPTMSSKLDCPVSPCGRRAL